MKAAVLYRTNEPLRVEDFQDPPEPSGSEVLVRVEASGLCHTDVHIWEGHYGPLRIEERGVSFPLIMGHEVAGSVAAVGDAVKGFKPGDRVLVYPWMGDGVCKMCLSGNENLCSTVRPLGILMQGGFAEYVLIPHYRYLLRADGLPLTEAAVLPCAGITAYSAVRKAAVGPGDFLVIQGVGGLGHLAVQVASAIYRPSIIAVDVRDEALELARRIGAEYTVNAAKQSMVDEIKRITGGDGADAVIDFVNFTETTLNAFSSLRRGGRLVLLGLSGEYSRFILPLIPLRGITIAGSYVGAPRDLIETSDLLRRGVIRPVTRPMKMEEVNEAIKMILEGRVVGRIVLHPR